MENQILYGVAKMYSELGKIVEYIVVKETPKTYIVKERINSDWGNWERTVRKSDMTVGSCYPRKLVKTYPEAIELAKQFIRERIDINYKEIEKLKTHNVKFAEKLKELEDGE